MKKATLIVLIVLFFAGCLQGYRISLERADRSARIEYCRKKLIMIMDENKRKEFWHKCYRYYLDFYNTTEDYTPDTALPGLGGYVTFTARTKANITVWLDLISVKIDCGGEEVNMSPIATDNPLITNWHARCKVVDNYRCGVPTPNRIVFHKRWWSCSGREFTEDHVFTVNIPVYEGGDDDIVLIPEPSSDGITHVEESIGLRADLWVCNRGPGDLVVESINLNCLNSINEWIPCTDDSYVYLHPDTQTFPDNVVCGEACFQISIEHIPEYMQNPKIFQLIVETDKEDFMRTVIIYPEPSA